jgi:hypothetical protein
MAIAGNRPVSAKLESNMAKSQTISIRQAAALRAWETRELNMLRRIRETIANSTNAVVRSVLPVIDAELAKAPAPVAKPVSANRHHAALKAHRTMLQAKLGSVRGKARQEILAKIAEYDNRLAA